MALRLTDYKVLTFDCYGTLIDWESGIWDAFQPLLMASGRADVRRAEALMLFARCEAAQQAATPDMPYPQVLRAVHAAMASELKLDSSPDMDVAFGNSVPHWPAFPDSADALRFLKTQFQLVILSNVDRAGFAASNSKLGVLFDAVYTAQDIGSYKPDPANFAYLLSALKSDLGLMPDDVLHTAQSLRHDHQPARAAGLKNVWIDRQRLSEGGDWGATLVLDEMPAVEGVFFSMAELAEAVRVEMVGPG